jgi:flagellar biosynthetic protein FlhB
MAQQEQDRSEAATPFKLAQARKRGSVAKSADLNTVFIVAALLACLQAWSGIAAIDQTLLSRALIQQAAAVGFSASQVWSWAGRAATDTLVMLAPLLAAIVVASVVSGLVQHGAVISTQPLKPDFNRLNPAAGLKRIFSRRALFELGKNLLKLALFSWAIYLAVRHAVPELMQLLFTDVRGYGPRMLTLSTALVFKLLLVIVGLALIDVLFTRWEHADNLRMSRREVKDEHRQREGDPKVKARIRELQNEARSKSRALKNIPQADVLVTNPTHLAVALMYRHGQMSAPTVVAKGSGELVEKMKMIARRHRVTILENRRLARALHEVALHGAVPEAHYPEVARILVWVQEARKRAGQQGAAN